MPDSLSCRHEQLSGVPVCCITLHFRDQRSVASLQKSRRDHRSLCETKPYPVNGFRAGAKDILYNVNIVQSYSLCTLSFSYIVFC